MKNSSLTGSRSAVIAILFTIGIAFGPVTQLIGVADAQLRMPFKRANTNTGQSFELTQSAGPWLIMCYSFSGDNAMPQAQRLATELRSQYNLKTYIYSHKFDLTKSLPQTGLAWQHVKTPEGETYAPQKMKPAGVAEFSEIAVLVGDFATIDDSRAQKTLAKVKSLQPVSLSNFDPLEASEDEALAGARLRYWREGVNVYQKFKDPNYTGKGPLAAAFLLTNPTLPDEYFQAQSVDSFVLNLNKPVKYSLLKNPKMYSVRVASFRGDSTFNLGEIDDKKREFSWLKRNKQGVESNLMEAAVKANKLTEAFRKQGIEAYEFHDRHESYVCVGSFEWVAKEDSNGNKRQNPQVVETILKYKGTIESYGNAQNVVRPFVPKGLKKNDGIACDVQPVPVLVPRADGSARTASGFLGRFKR